MGGPDERCRSRRRCWGGGLAVSKEEGQESLDRTTDYRREHFNATGSKRAQLPLEQSTHTPLWKKENTNSPLYSGYQRLPSHTSQGILHVNHIQHTSS